MQTDLSKTTSELAAEAGQVSADARQAARGYASESRRIVREAAASIRPSAEALKDLAGQAADTGSGLAHDAGDLSRSTMRTAKAYASRGVEVARDRMVQATGATRQYVSDNPMRTTLAAAATGAAIMVLMRHALKGRARA